MRRRTFVGLTGATMVSSILDGIPRPRPPADVEAPASVLTGHTADPAALPTPPDIKALAAAANDARSADVNHGAAAFVNGKLAERPVQDASLAA